ncbi:MAG: benzoate-CoA ligase family protein, partial [Oxalobacteraceae bacterium]
MQCAIDPNSGRAVLPASPFPYPYNAAADLIERNLAAGRGQKIAVYDDLGSYTYAELATRVNRFAGALTELGICIEQRILL